MIDEKKVGYLEMTRGTQGRRIRIKMDCNNCKNLGTCIEEEWIITSSDGENCDDFEPKER